jgi:uncharacterized protein YxjI
MELKILCHCGIKYKFDVELVHGRLPAPVHCPNCGVDGTAGANQMLAQLFPAAAPAAATAPSLAPVAVAAAPASLVPAVPAGSNLRISGKTSAAAGAPASVPTMDPEPALAPEMATGSALLNRTTLFIKERTGMLKLTDTYDILDPRTGANIGIAKEEPPTWAKWVRLAIDKSKLPTAVNVYETEGQRPVVSVRRGFNLFRGKTRVVAGDGRPLGYFKTKLISIGAGFLVFDARDQQVAEVKGNWKGKEFRFLNKSGREIGTITKKWAGLGKELFSSADNYIISLTDLTEANPDVIALLLAAGLAIDVVFYEGKG